MEDSAAAVSGFVCDCEAEYLTACRDLPVYGEYEGKRYCVLHFPSEDKVEAFDVAVKQKVDLGDFDFGAAVFPHAISFSGLSMTNARFTMAVFKDSADFNRARFLGAVSFGGAEFCESATFYSAHFGGSAGFDGCRSPILTLFDEAVFEGESSFVNAQFSTFAFFKKARFIGRAEFLCTVFDAITSFEDAQFGFGQERQETVFSSAFFTKKVDFCKAAFCIVAFEDARFEAKHGQLADFSQSKHRVSTSFDKCRFKMPVHFRQAAFEGSLSARDAEFHAEASFSSASFARADFSSTVFKGEADFVSAKFVPDRGLRSEAIFQSTTFEGRAGFAAAAFGGNEAPVEVSFHSAMFAGEVDFGFAVFSDQANFWFATFKGPTDFRDAVFSGLVNFSFVTVASHMRFRGSAMKPAFRGTELTLASERDGAKKLGSGSAHSPVAASLTWEDANVERPERVSFHTVALRPHWFINVDPRKFEFINVQWDGSLVDELERIQPQENRHRLLSIAARQLALNAEENHRYEEASSFRYLSMEAALARHGVDYAVTRLEWWYRLASGYGERVGRGFAILCVIWLVFAGSYTAVRFVQPGDDAAGVVSRPVGKPHGKTLHLTHAVAYSLGVIALQKPEPKPDGLGGQALVIVESILGPLQAALLALAVRRKFMK